MKPSLNGFLKLFIVLVVLFSGSAVFSQTTNSSNTTGTLLPAAPTYTINSGLTSPGQYGSGSSSSLILTPANGYAGGGVTITAGSGYMGTSQGGNITLNPGAGTPTNPYPGKIILNAPGNSSITLGQINVSSTGVMSNISSLTATGTITANSFISNGNVGIGTINLQGYKLAVNGGIICEEVKVITDVPASDFVFEEGYKLATLSEVEKYVKANKHLPGIPSAEEFKKNGYSVGKMDDMLLKHVEEMMLHLIELEKENKRLSKEIEILKNK